MKFKKITCTLITFLIFLSVSVLAAQNYVNDSAGVLSSSTINLAEKNFSALQNKTGAYFRVQTIKSLNGKSMNDYAQTVANEITSTDKYAIFIVSTQDHKIKFLVGPGLNAVFSSAEKDRIASLPNQYFKNNDFNTGILKVGEAVDKDITAKAVQTGNAVVVDNGMSKTVQPVKAKESHAGTVIFIIFLVVAGIVIIYIIKKKSQTDVDKFARQHGVNNGSNGKTFSSSNFANGKGNTSYSTNREEPNQMGANHTTIINNGSYNNDRGFVEGMILGEMLEHHDHHDHHEHYDHHDNVNGRP